MGSESYPVQIVWAAQDPAMPAGTYGEKARAAAQLPAIDRIPGKHFPQEDQAPAIAARIAAIATGQKSGKPGALDLTPVPGRTGKPERPQ